MKAASTIWAWTSLFSQGGLAADSAPPSGLKILRPDVRVPRKLLLAFRHSVKADKVRSVVIFDVARFPGKGPWAYVADGINKSGANPLRGLGPLLSQPFTDTSRLYQVPLDETGVVANSLGDRYPGSSDRPDIICSHLQTLALLAHAAGAAVTGVLVAESQLAQISPERFFGDFRQVMTR